MKKRMYYIGTITLTMVMFLSTQGLTQELEPGEVLPEFSKEERIEQFASNMNGLVFAFISYAKEQGQSAEEAGRYLGEFFARGWPDDFTPEFYVTAMNRNWQMYGVTMEVLDVGDDYVKVRRSEVQFDGELEQAYQEIYGYGISDFRTFFRHVEKGIASEHGMELSFREEDDYVVFTISR